MPEQLARAEAYAARVAEPARRSETPILLLDSAARGYGVVAASAAFERQTGYRARQLEVPRLVPLMCEKDAETVRGAIVSDTPLLLRVTCRHCDGRPFERSVEISPLRIATGSVTGYAVRLGEPSERFAGTQLAEARRQVALAEGAATRSAVLAEATSDLSVSLDIEGSLHRLARLLVPSIADWVIIDLASEDTRPVHIAMLHRDGMEDVVRRFTELQPDGITDAAPQLRILRGEEPILVGHAETSNATAHISDPELLELCNVLGTTSVMYVPLTARDRVLGALTLVSGRSGRVYTPEDLAFACDLARRAALVVDNTSLYEREHRVAQVLQESLLPKLPDVPGLDVAARYLPSDHAAAVGGDFYDVLQLPDASVGLAVGDVVGHDLKAAAAMGQLRGLLRSCAWDAAERGSDAGSVLARVDALAQALQVTSLATASYCRMLRSARPDGPWSVNYASAGHPPPLVRLPGGSVVALDQACGVALGVARGVSRRAASARLPAGSMLVAFTDGLVERRGEDWFVGIDRVRKILLALPEDLPAGKVADELLGLAANERFDDVAILVARLL
ncbi:MAG: hypothetical protein JWM85_361 [Acidimicrobiaceae bacterium]|nr:hypothetical protein [Acidimicrobiaceae bacterium]